jgi:hydrogenase maturation protein HypF
MLRKIHVTGLVQGVGFRPFVYQIATRENLVGWVANTSAGVDIEVEGDAPALDSFLCALTADKPPLALIDAVQVKDIVSNGPAQYDRFDIRASVSLENAFQPISPDISICPDCLRELFDPNDRRYLYPFINCTNCGPRFTIIRDIPYDRPNTTMRAFEMCGDCAHEYNDPLDRRFHAQPVACPRCGPKVWLEIDGKRDEEDAAIQGARRLLANGKIIAIKGLGGFHLACDATNMQSVAELRQRKLRVDKPFALMMPEIATIEEHCFLDACERALLESRERPIVLLRRRPDSPIAAQVAPGNHYLGVMLPYTPLHYLLMAHRKPPLIDARSTRQPSAIGRIPSALVMTSGNLSEEPIASDNDDARTRLAMLADAFLMHDRDICTRCDDSVMRVFSSATIDSQNSEHISINPVTYPLRRSRGYAPFPVRLPFDAPPLLATGAELKNTFCITRDRYAFLSHHVGDLENYETLRSFEDGVSHLTQLFRLQPEALAYDLHPDYFATRYALARAEREGLPAIGVQHHHAHIAACMAENGLSGVHSVIGVAFDGTGYGTDGAIWGGEILIANYGGYRRAFHLDYIPMPGGDKAVREPWRLALVWLARAGIEWTDEFSSVLQARDQAWQVIRRQARGGPNAPPTSSMGRLFDAVAAIAGIRQSVNYEAQAAIEFEMLVDPDEMQAYEFGIRADIVDPVPVIRAVVADLRNGVSTTAISARFHNGVATMVQRACALARERYCVNQVALSGGVWQNVTLLKRTVELLQNDGLTVHIHHLVPANDGGLALGQAAVAAWKRNKQ